MAKREPRSASSTPAAGRYAYEGLDRVIHEKARLGIMTSLLTQPQGLAFNELKQLCGLTDGNLNRHLEVLHEAGFVEMLKESGAGRPRTFCQVTAAGRAGFARYLAELERVVADVAATQQVPRATPARFKPA